MKKLLVSIIVAVLVLTSLTGTVFGATADNISQVPDIKIIMEGSLAKYNNTPISISGRTMLPLRELVVMLGVPNDDEHISYNNNGTDKIVTVKYDETEIVLYIGKNDAYVNGKKTTMDVAPVLHNNSTYIPLRFVAEALNKKVVWEGESRSILISDEGKFNTIKDILEKSKKASEDVKKAKLDMKISLVAGTDVMKVNMGVEANALIDSENKQMQMKMLMDMLGMEIKSESYYSDNTEYTYNALSNGWEKRTLTKDEYQVMFESQSNVSVIDAQDALAAGLTIAEGKDDEIVLKGDVYLASLFQNSFLQQSGITSDEEVPDFSDCSLELVLDKKTYLVKSMDMKVKAEQMSEGQKVTIDMEIVALYSDYNGNFKITVPAEVVKNAVEVKPDNGSGVSY